MEKGKQLGWRLFFYLFGLFVMAVGVYGSVQSRLGVSPVNSLPYSLSIVSGISLGRCVTLIFAGYVAIQLLILRREFQLKSLLQLVVSALFGYFVDLVQWLLPAVTAERYFLRLLMLAVSICLLALGLTCYLATKLPPMAMEGLTFTISQKCNKIPFHKVKIALDCTSILLAVVLTFVGTGRVEGVREGTILSALLVGRMMGLMSPIGDRIRKRCFFEAQPSAQVEDLSFPAAP